MSQSRPADLVISNHHELCHVEPVMDAESQSHHADLVIFSFQRALLEPMPLTRYFDWPSSPYLMDQVIPALQKA